MIETTQQPKVNISPAPDSDGPDGLTHIWCCDPNVAHCGSDISGGADVAPTETLAGSPECVVCDDLDDEPCPRGCERRQG